MADYTTLKAAIASVIKTNGNQEITGLLLQQTLHSMLDGVNTTKQDTINFVINTANKFLRDDGTFQEIQSPAGGFANNLYFTDIDSVVVSGYKTLSYNPDAGTINLNASVTAAEGVKTVQNYLYPSGVSVDLFPSGLWSFNFYAYLDLNVGNTQIGVQYFKRSVAGVETNLFTAWSAEINNTTPLWIKFETTNPSFIVDPTDRMGARILVKTTSTPAVNLTIAIGDGYAAYLNNPNRIRHSQLRDWNGDPNYQHITQTEKTNFQTAYTDRFKWDGGSSGLNAVTGRESLGLRIGIDVLAYRTFGSAANNNTNDFLAYNGVAVDSSKLGGQLPSYYQTNITAGTSLQYYRGDKTMQTLDTSVVPENSNMYFTYPRVLATALTGYAAGANTALSASDTILAAMGKIQGQINARALASDLSGHINNTTIHLTADEKTYLGKIMTYLKVAVDNTSMYSTLNFYSESGVSAFGIGSGGGGSVGVDIIDDLLSVRTDAALSANQGRILKGFVDLKQPQLNGTGLVRMSGTSVSYDNTSYATSASLLSHTGNTSNPHSVTFAQLLSKPTTFEGYGIMSSVNGISMNTIKNSAAYYGYNMTDSASATISTFLVLKYSNDWGTQIQHDVVNRELYFRSWTDSGGVMDTSWRKIYHSSNLLNIGTTASSARTALELTGTVSTHNHNGTYALISGATTQDFQVKALTMNGALSGATTGSFSGRIIAGGITSGRYNVFTSYLEMQYGNRVYFYNSDNTLSAAIYHNGTSLYVNGATTFSSTIQATTAKLTNLTDGYIPYHISDASGLGNSIISQSGTTINVGGALTIAGALSGATTGSFSGNVSAASFTSGGNAVIHSGNIGSQSVNYATNANNAEKLKSYYPTGNIDVNTYLSSGGALWYYGQVATMANIPSWFTYGSIYQFNSTTSDSLSLQIATSTLHDTTTPSYKIGWRMSNNLGYQNDWKEIYHSGNLTNTLSNGYLPYWNAPNGRLENSGLSNDGVYTNVHQPIRLTNNGFYLGSPTHGHRFYDNGSNYNNFIIYENGNTYTRGNVGIGYTNRDEKFAVNGSGYFNTTLEVAGITSFTNTTQSTAYTNGGLVLSGGLGIAKDLYSNGLIKASKYRFNAGSYEIGIYSERFSFTNEGTAVAMGANMGSLLISNTWGDSSKVPTNGIYSKGQIWSATSIKIGANWEAIPNGTDLELRYGGVMKAKLSSSGDILAVGGVTAFAV